MQKLKVSLTNICCPLCASDVLDCFYIDPHFFDMTRHFYRCKKCELHFVPESEHISKAEEKERYHLHINSPQDAGYVQFLRQLTDPLWSYLPKGAEGLDFGCGPGPAVKSILEPDFTVVEYDPYFLNRPEVLTRTYDFIIATEVIEHFRTPREDFKKLNQLVKPNGMIGLMSDLRSGTVDFKQWGYKNDPTHLMFYTPETIDFIADQFGWEVLTCDMRVVILRK